MFLNNTVIKTCKVLDPTPINNKLTVVELDKDSADGSYSQLQAISPFILNGQTKWKKGALCLVIFTNNEPNSTCYILGSLDSAFDFQNLDELESDEEEGLISKKRTTSMYITDGSVAFYAGKDTGDNSKFDMTTKNVDIQGGAGTFNLSDSNFKLAAKNNNFAISAGSGNLNIISKQGNINQSAENIRLRSAGTIRFEGDIDEDASETNQKVTYGSASNFYVNAEDIQLVCEGGMFNQNGAACHISLAGGFLADPIPGLGPSDTFKVDAVLGDISMFAGGGNITISTPNIAQINSILLRCGTLLAGSDLNLDATSARLANFVPGLYSTLDLNLGNATLDTTLDITLSAFKNVDILANANISIDALASMSLSSLSMKLDATTKIDINANASMTIKSQTISVQAGSVLNLSGSTIINAGPKVAAPTGSGPFCAIPACIFSGAPHVGSVAQ